MRNLFLLSLLSFLLFSCSSNKEERLKRIEEINKIKGELYNSVETQNIDFSSAYAVVSKIDTFVEKFPRDTANPSLIIEQATILSNYLGNSRKAITVLLKLQEKHPKCKEAPTALFFAASLYQDKLKKVKEAKETYQLLIDKYPESELTEQAKLIIRFVGKSDEELYEEIMKMRAAKEEKTVTK